MAFPPVDAGPVALIALVPLSLFFRKAGPAPLAWASAVFGLCFFGIMIYWIRLFGTHAYIGLVVVQTLWITASLQLARVLRTRMPDPWLIFALPAAYLIGEFARSYLPWGGFGWGVFGYSQHNNPVALKLASFTGVWGISFGVVLINVLLAEAIVRYRQAPRAAAKLLVAALGIALFPAVLPVGEPDGERAKIAMIQGNVPGDAIHPNDDDEEVVQNHVELTRELDTSEISLVVWPEGSFDRDPFREPAFEQALVSAIRRANTPFHVGAILGTRSEGLRNTSLLFDPDGTLSGIYAKQRLVPFGEFVPLRRFLQPWIRALDQIPVDLVAGESTTVFSIPSGTFGSVICYESTYPDIVRSMVKQGARMLVVSTNFSSYERTAAADQHIAFSQLRAAEHRMWVAHTAVSGKSAVIAPDGRVMDNTGLFEQAVLTPEVRFATTTTPYARLGDWVPYLAIVVAVLVILIGPISRIYRAKAER